MHNSEAVWPLLFDKIYASTASSFRGTPNALLREAVSGRSAGEALEASVIPDWEAQSPTYPMPMLTFFSEQTPEPPQRVNGNLPRSDILFMNVVVARTRGVALWDLALEVAIGKVDWNDFLTAVEKDMTMVLEGGAMLHSPFLAVLDLCRC